jgi:hypothetical protein
MRRFWLLFGFFLLGCSSAFSAFAVARRWVLRGDPLIYDDYLHQTWFYYADIVAGIGTLLSHGLLGLALLIPRRRSAKKRALTAPIVRRGPILKMRLAIRPGLYVVGIASAGLIGLIVLVKESSLEAHFFSELCQFLQLAGKCYLSFVGLILLRKMSHRPTPQTLPERSRISDSAFEFGQRSYTHRRVWMISTLAALAAIMSCTSALPYLYFKYLGGGAGGIDEYFSIWRTLVTLYAAALVILCFQLLAWRRRRRREV